MPLNVLRGIFARAIQRCLDTRGVEALKKTSLFGSNS